MKAKVLCLFLCVGMLMSCGNDDAASENFSSSVEMNGTGFNPDRGTYSVREGDLHRELNFSVLEGEAAENSPAMSIMLYVPYSWDSVSGSYFPTFGEAQTPLIGAYLYRGGNAYYIHGDTVEVTDLGNNRFRFEFADEFASTLQGETFPFNGTIEGTFTRIETP
ncbi:MAG: hypothetical protein EOO01_07305 [Chitinophagaceae bacterium]|nr:MAG: hypothetical protein EOO01_07305 [Chitinophagaceae bacterium]